MSAKQSHTHNNLLLIFHARSHNKIIYERRIICVCVRASTSGKAQKLFRITETANLYRSLDGPVRAHGI